MPSSSGRGSSPALRFELRLKSALLLIPLAALAACATTPAPPPSPPLAPIAGPALPTVTLVALTEQSLADDPFRGAGVELEPLPIPAGDLWERIVRGYRIAQVDGPLVDKWQGWYAQRPDYVARMVERSRRYLYHIVNQVELRGMPLDLALLPMVESAFNPHAISGARASGIWQFMPSTGTTYGLKQNWWYDSRRDVVAATTSALDYLQNLEAEFGDWQLALAAYNWGEGNVRKAIARNQARGLPTDFASLTGVPDETRNYLPKLQAVKDIVADPSRFNLALAEVPDAPYFTIVKMSRLMDVKRAAELAELPLEEFLSLNPQHNRPVIAGADEYALLLPTDHAEIFAAKLDLIDQPLVSWQAYRMKAGDTLPQVAAKFGLSIETLRTINGIGARAQLPVGHALLVPAQTPSADVAASLKSAVFTTVPSGRTFYYTVRRGDTLARIGGRYGVSSQDLRRWNGLTQEHVKVGQQLRVTTDALPVRTARGGRHAPPAASRSASSSRAGAPHARTPAKAMTARAERTKAVSGALAPARRPGAPAVAQRGGGSGG
jgi:membrane-bound lytic murein transglycosylase D